MSISALNQAALESEHSSRIYFLFLDLAIDPFRACTGVRTYTTLGFDWLGIGEIAGISDIADAADIAARQVTISASGVDPWITEPVLSRTNYKGRAAVIYRGMLDAENNLIDDPWIIWQGRMDVGSMVWEDNYTAQIVCEPLAARLLRPNISRYSDEDHQIRHPGDKFFEFLPQMEKKDANWGGQRIAPATSGVGGAGGFGIDPAWRRLF